MEENQNQVETPEVVEPEFKPIDRKAPKEYNQAHFAILYTIVTVALIVFVFKYFNPESGPAYGSAIRIGAVSMQSVALWFISALGFTAALNGLKCNVYKEIVDNKNTALAILMGFAWLSLAITIHG